MFVKGLDGAAKLTGVVEVAAGSYHSFALLSDGTVVAWGYNANGQLGDGTTTNQTTPVPVCGVDGSSQRLGGVAQLGLGGVSDHSLALLSDGRAVAWGRNDYGQLGDGTLQNRPRPVVVQLPQE